MKIFVSKKFWIITSESLIQECGKKIITSNFDALLNIYSDNSDEFICDAGSCKLPRFFDAA